MTHNDSHLMALIDEFKQSRDSQLVREAKLIDAIEHLLKRIERLEESQKVLSAYALRQSNNALTSGLY